MNCKTVIFDLDGTLLDSLEGLWHSTNAGLAAVDAPSRTLEEVRCFVGNGIGKLIERALPGAPDDPRYAPCLAAFRADYETAMFTGSRPYPGILSLLETLKGEGYRLAVVSNKIDPAVKALNERFFAGLIPVAIGEQPGMVHKPAPDSVYAALDALNCGREGAVYVGDSEVDLQTAANSGLPCLAVDWGNRTAEQLKSHGAASISHTPEELLAAIRAL